MFVIYCLFFSVCNLLKQQLIVQDDCCTQSTNQLISFSSSVVTTCCQTPGLLFKSITLQLSLLWQRLRARLCAWLVSRCKTGMWGCVCVSQDSACVFSPALLSVSISVSESAVRTVILIRAFIRPSCLPGWNFSLQVGAGIIWLLNSCQHRFTVEGNTFIHTFPAPVMCVWYPPATTEKYDFSYWFQRMLLLSIA